MDTDIPLHSVAVPSFLTERWQTHLGVRNTKTNRRNGRSSSSKDVNIQKSNSVEKVPLLPTLNDGHVSAFGTLPWLDDGDDDITHHKKNTFLSHWNYQLSYFMDHLTNVRVNPDETVDKLMHVERVMNSSHHHQQQQQRPQDGTDETTQRIFTISFQSDEYRDIRMSYLHTNGAQVYRCACYPRNGDMPILGMGLMQFGGGVRNVAILDFQPLSKDSDHPFRYDAMYDDELQRIRSTHPFLQQDMSNRHFDPNEKQFYSTRPIIGKWSGKDENDTAMWEQLQTAHEQCVQTHVDLTKRLSGNNNNKNGPPSMTTSEDVLALHASFDEFVSAREPASCLLAQAFGGKDISDRIIHQVIFPLSRRNQDSLQERS